MRLRPYQEELIEKYDSAIARGDTRVMLQSPTGAGKTRVFSEIARRYADDGKKVIVLSHRRELVNQASKTLSNLSGLPTGIIQGNKKIDERLNLHSASVATLVNRLAKIDPESIDLVVTDEGHHSSAASYRKIYDHFQRSHKLAVSATPIRTDGRGFDDLFDVLIPGPSVKSLIEQGHLSPYRLFADPLAMKVEGVKKVAGEYSAKQLAEANDEVQLSGRLTDSYLRHCPGKRCLVFAINVIHSEQIAAAYRAIGIPAMHVDAETPLEIRDKAIEQFAAGELLVLSNVGLFTEGTDIPAIEAVQVARPTASLALWLQMVGRGLRLFPGKDIATIIDHTSNYARHGLPCASRAWSLEGVYVPPAKSAIAVDEKTGEVLEKLLPLDGMGKPIIEQAIDLEEIDLDPLKKWLPVYTALLTDLRKTGKPAGWLVSRLQADGAPLEIFELAETEFGYSPGWAALVWRVGRRQYKQSKSQNKKAPYGQNWQKKKSKPKAKAAAAAPKPKSNPDLFELLAI